MKTDNQTKPEQGRAAGQELDGWDWAKAMSVVTQADAGIKARRACAVRLNQHRASLLADVARLTAALDVIIRLADSIEPQNALSFPYRQEVVQAARAALAETGERAS